MLHMAYGTIVPFPSYMNRKQRLQFKGGEAPPEELVRHLRPAIAKRVLDSRRIRQATAARS